MSDEIRAAAAPELPPEDDGPQEPRVWITKGSPWTIDAARRERWSAPEAVAEHAVDIRQVGDPVLHAPAKKPRMDRRELEVLAQRMFASMLVAHGVGIAAQQIGVPLRVVIIDVDGNVGNPSWGARQRPRLRLALPQVAPRGIARREAALARLRGDVDHPRARDLPERAEGFVRLHRRS